MKIITIPNLLSITRIFLVPFFSYFLYIREPFLSFIILCLIALTDLFDGMVARILREESKLGRILDHLIDKFVIACILITLSLFKDFPWWGAILIISRDVVSLYVGFVLLRKGKIMSSNMFGKFSGVVFALTTLSFLFQHGTRFFLFYLSIISFLFASISYLFYALKFLKRAEKPAVKLLK